MFEDYKQIESLINKILKEISSGNKLPKSIVSEYIERLEKWIPELKETMIDLMAGERVSKEKINDPSANAYLAVPPRKAAENFKNIQSVIMRMIDCRDDLLSALKKMNK
jgi:exoribonuclease II